MADEELKPQTPFSAIYDDFFVRVTDDMYLEWTEHDTMRDLQNILISSLPRFEFPRFDIFDYALGEIEVATNDETGMTSVQWRGGYFNSELTREEINILSLSMMVEWFGRQMATIELTRMKFTSADFKMTSQANHLAKLKVLQDTYRQECFHLQRLYKRRIRTENGEIRSTMGLVMTTPSYGYKI